jgi:hypothetical protein
MHEVREFAGHSDIRTTELYFVRKEEDAEVAARRIQIRAPRSEARPAAPADAETRGITINRPGTYAKAQPAIGFDLTTLLPD